MVEILIGVPFGICVGYITAYLILHGVKDDLVRKIESKSNTIKSLHEMNLKIQKEMIQFKGAAASEETRANLLQKMKDDLQKEYDELNEYYRELSEDYKGVVADYKELFIRLQDVDTEKFRDPETLKVLESENVIAK